MKKRKCDDIIKIVDEYPIIQMLAPKVLQLSKDENESNEAAITYSMDKAEDTGDATQYFGVDLGDDHSAIKLLVVVTNLGSIFYMVKSHSFDIESCIVKQLNGGEIKKAEWKK